MHISAHISDTVKRLFKDINVNLLRKFTRLFKKEEVKSPEGQAILKNRDWRQMSEERIRQIWNTYRQMLDGVIQTEFKVIKVPKRPFLDSLGSTIVP